MGHAGRYVATRAGQCDGKESYTTRGLADRVVARRRKTDATLNVYRCPHCGGWHIGRSSRRTLVA